MRNVVTASSMVLCLFAIVKPVVAQEPAPPASGAASDGIEIVTGLMEFDLSGTGTTMPVVIRASKALTQHLALEVGATIARPQQQFGGSTMTIPEAQLSYSWALGRRVRPFVSGGAGIGLFQSDVRDNWWRPTFSAGGGARILLNDRVYAVGEMRLRGISRQFSATTAEWLGGIGLRLS